MLLVNIQYVVYFGFILIMLIYLMFLKYVYMYI